MSDPIVDGIVKQRYSEREETMPKLTKEQAVVLTAVTGTTCCSIKYVVQEVERRLGRTVHPSEFNNVKFQEEIKDLFFDDFLAIVYRDELSRILLPNG